ncbi:hypothetical protein OP492_26125 [Pseudomonas mosselii]|uniref:DUF6896 domain-containing protein n=1 Tax=Pseudomonas mosselii TaxID=78327 RepID=UPI002B05A9FA|nr:hypothetical protein [Pseudomonas mosselii]MEA3238135.1 hypothetical protein [Pseudomonas mosselii]
MGQINMGGVFLFVELQCKLALAFLRSHPGAKDLTWLLEFPKAGEVFVDGDKWQFIRHGSGLRFEKMTCKGGWVVDIHKCFHDPRIIDGWRLLQFFDSRGECMDKSQVSLLLNEMCLREHLLDQGGGQYLFVG